MTITIGDKAYFFWSLANFSFNTDRQGNTDDGNGGEHERGIVSESWYKGPTHCKS